MKELLKSFFGINAKKQEKKDRLNINSIKKVSDSEFYPFIMRNGNYVYGIKCKTYEEASKILDLVVKVYNKALEISK